MRASRDLRIFSITPVKCLAHCKERLAPFLDAELHKELIFRMLGHVLNVLTKSSSLSGSVVVSPDSRILDFAADLGAYPLPEEDEVGVNGAVLRATEYCFKLGADATMVIPSDIALIREEDIKELAILAQEGAEVVLTPSLRYDGTNALVRSPPDVIQTYYEKDSFFSHLKSALAKHLNTQLYLSRSLMIDIDSAEDIYEVRSIDRRIPSIDFFKTLPIKKAL